MVNTLVLGLALWVGAVGLVMALRAEEVVRFRERFAAGVGATGGTTPAKVTLVRWAGAGLAVLGGALGLVAVL